MKRLLLVALAALLLSGQTASANFHHGGNTQPFQSTLNVGAGGFLVGLDIANDGWCVARPDTFGAWVRAPGASGGCSDSAGWVNVISTATMPAADSGYFPITGTSQLYQNSGAPYEIRPAPSNSQIAYMVVQGWLFSTGNLHSGASTAWTKKTAFNNAAVGSPSTAIEICLFSCAYRMNNAKMAVDPNNPLHVLVGTELNGLIQTTDGFATTGNTTKVSSASIPTSTDDNGAAPGGCGNTVGDLKCYPAYLIAFDPSSTHTCGSGSDTCTVYVFNYVNTAGVLTGKLYKSTDGGSTWAAQTTGGGPTSVQDLKVAATGGAVYAVGGALQSTDGAIWTWASSTWASLKSACCHTVSIDPADATHLVAVDQAGALYVSGNTGSGWSAKLAFTRTATDIPWLANSATYFLDAGAAIFDQTQTNKLVLGAGTDVWNTTPPPSGSFVWNSVGLGIEQLVARSIIAPNGVPIVGAADKATFKLNAGNTYPTTQNNTYLNAFSLNVTSWLDYASSDSTFMVSNTTGFLGSFPALNNSGYSTDGGTNWQTFNSYKIDVAAAALASGCGVSTNHVQVDVGAAGGTTTGLTTYNPTLGTGSLIRMYGYNAGNTSGGLYYPITVNDSTHFTLQAMTIGGNDPTTCASFDQANGNYRIIIDTQPLTDLNGVMTVTGTANVGGNIQITVTGNSGNITNGTPVCLSAVGGTTNANGCHIIDATNFANQFKLVNSVFNSAWTSGGVAKIFAPPGGYIAASTDQNIILVPEGDSYPQCTTDRGLTWAEIRYPAGVATAGTTGWGFAPHLNRHVMVADRVTPNTFYGYNYLTGVIKIVNCGAPTLVSNGGTPVADFFSGAESNAGLKSVPGNAGHLFFAAGPQGGAATTHPQPTVLSRSKDGGVTWASIPRINEPIAVGFGAVGPGKTYPTVYVVGWYNVDNVSDWQFGIWRSTDGDQTTPTWTKVASYPLGIYSLPVDISGDGAVWNKWYMGWTEIGFTYGQQN